MSQASDSAAKGQRLGLGFPMGRDADLRVFRDKSLRDPMWMSVDCDAEVRGISIGGGKPARQKPEAWGLAGEALRRMSASEAVGVGDVKVPAPHITKVASPRYYIRKDINNLQQ